MSSVPKTANPHDTVPDVNRKRSLAKAISWRIVGTLDTLLLAFVVLTFLGPLLGMEKASPSENAQTATYIAITEFLTKLFLYYAHEQIWARVKWAVVFHDGRRRELPRRSGVKTATWRVTASLDTMLLAWIFTGSIATAVSIGTLEVITKLFLYYFHERLWSRVQWGVNTRALPIETTGKS